MLKGKTVKLFVMAVKGSSPTNGTYRFHADFYVCEYADEAIDQAKERFLQKYPEHNQIATSFYALDSGILLNSTDGSDYRLLLEKVEKTDTP